jgi:hypothetical protein
VRPHRHETRLTLYWYLGKIAGPGSGSALDVSNLAEIAEGRIWTGVATAGQEKFTLGHVLFFAWFANLAMHIGLSDMALFATRNN